MRSFIPHLALIAAVGSTACGNFSQEDLLFLAALPSRDQLALTPPGADDPGEAGAVEQALTQGLTPEEVCAAADKPLRCHALALAIGFNKLTFGLLDIVDHVSEMEPSRRSPGRRIWGPFPVDDKGITARFEMTRDAATNHFHYCLHVKIGFAGPAADNDVDCDVETSERGFIRFLSGDFTPGDIEDHRAKSGVGDLLLEARNIPNRDEGMRAIDSIAIHHDSTAGTDITLTITPEDDTIEPPHYHFEQAEDGSGALDFTATFNLDGTSTLVPEHLWIQAKWLADKSGRAEADVTEGDAGGEHYHVDECWNAAFETVFQRAYFGFMNETTTGDARQCSITEPFVFL